MLNTIHWGRSKGEGALLRPAHIHMIIVSDEPTMKHINEAVTKLRETFPWAQDDKIRIGRISTFSPHHMAGGLVIVWNDELAMGDYASFVQTFDAPKYSWF